MKKILHGFVFVCQLCFYWLIYPLANLIYGNKRVWIICERGDDARDNGYWMFKYLHTEHCYVNQYYLIDKKSADYQKISKYGKVVKYKSLKHWFLYCAAEVRMTTHLAAFAPGNFLGEWFKHHKQKGVNVFLQHGITHNEFPSNYFEHNGSDLFICGAKPEYDHVLNNCHYPEKNVVYTGFARFDGLNEFTLKKQILVMPSWRSYLYGLKDEEFKKSNYFTQWFSLLSNKELIEYCRKENIKIVFYPHYSMQQYVNLFNKLNNDIVEVADFDHFDVQELLKESSLLITDYSSILFDFAYMRKPELLYQFDEDEFYGKHYGHSYFDHRRDGFGDIVTNENELISRLLSFNAEFKISSIYRQKIDNFFPLHDDQNCERIYQAIVRKFIEKKKKHLYVDELNVVVTGDDYGRNYESSEGIRQAYKKGYIQHISVMLNKDEKDTLNFSEIDKNICSLHINFTEGYATYGDTSVYAYSVNNAGSITHDELMTRKGLTKLSKSTQDILINEINGQISKYKMLGFNCESFDSHGHIHNNLPVAKAIIPILKENGFKKFRRPSNINQHSKLVNRFYKYLVFKKYNKFFDSTKYFGSCDDFIHIKHYRKFKKKSIEIMTHPFISKNGELCNRRDINFSLLYKENKQ